MADTTTPQARLQLGQLRAITEPAALACLSPAARADLADILAQALGQIHRLNRPDGNHAPLVQIIVTGGDADSEFYVRTIDEPWPEHLEPLRPLFSAHPGEACSLTYTRGTVETLIERIG